MCHWNRRNIPSLHRLHTLARQLPAHSHMVYLYNLAPSPGRLWYDQWRSTERTVSVSWLWRWSTWGQAWWCKCHGDRRVRKQCCSLPCGCHGGDGSIQHIHKYERYSGWARMGCCARRRWWEERCGPCVHRCHATTVELCASHVGSCKLVVPLWQYCAMTGWAWALLGDKRCLQGTIMVH